MTPERRRYQREYARRRRERRLEEELRTAQRCPFQLGPTPCGGKLETVVDRLGRAVVVCALCERRKAGICRDCPRRVAGRIGRALRCESCKRREMARAQDRYRARYPERVAARVQAYRTRPEVRAYRMAYKRAYRQQHPELVKREKRKAAITNNAAYQRHLAYHRRYNAKKRRQEKKRRQARLAYFERHPVRPIATCRVCGGFLNWAPAPGRGRPPQTCDAHCGAGERSRRRATGVSYVVVAEPPAAQLVPPTPLTPHTCLTCPTVLTGRRKKCDACKQRQRELAIAAFAAAQARRSIRSPAQVA